MLMQDCAFSCRSKQNFILRTKFLTCMRKNRSRIFTLLCGSCDTLNSLCQYHISSQNCDITFISASSTILYSTEYFYDNISIHQCDDGPTSTSTSASSKIRIVVGTFLSITLSTTYSPTTSWYGKSTSSWPFAATRSASTGNRFNSMD